MPESRKHPRKILSIAVGFRRDGGPLTAATSHDISLGGMFIETAAPASFGETIEVFLSLPGLARETAVQSVVRWTKPTGMGVQFGLMGALDTHALTELLAHAEA